MIRPLTETRRLPIGGAPHEVWADMLDRPDDVAAGRAVAAAVMGDVRRKKSWELAWRLTTGAAYRLAFQRRGQFVGESDLLARAVGHDLVSPADMAALQRLYTLTHAGCSTVMAWDEERGCMVHFRSLDWPSADAIAQASRLFTGHRPDGSQAFTAAGIIGMVGLLTAVKPGFSVAINFAPWNGPSLSPHSDPTFLIRRLMESPIGDYRAAHAAIAGWRPSAPVFISLCGVARGEACIFEFGAAWRRSGRVHAVPIGDRPFLVQTNHFAAHGPYWRHARRQAPPLPDDHAEWDDHGLLATSRARQALIERALDEDGGTLDERLQTVYRRRPVWNHETAQWVQMVPASGEMRAWVRH